MQFGSKLNDYSSVLIRWTQEMKIQLWKENQRHENAKLDNGKAQRIAFNFILELYYSKEENQTFKKFIYQFFRL